MSMKLQDNPSVFLLYGTFRKFSRNYFFCDLFQTREEAEAALSSEINEIGSVGVIKEVWLDRTRLPQHFYFPQKT